MAAAQALGWHATLIDGKGSVSDYNSAIQQAIALHASGIVLVAIEQDSVAGPVAAARHAGISVVSTLGDNTPDPNGIEYDTTPTSYSEANGRALGAYLIVESKGNASVAAFNAPEFKNVTDKYAGFISEMSKCPTCKVVKTVDFNDATMANTLPTQTVSLVQSDPAVNYIWNGFDAASTFQVPALSHIGWTGHLVSYDGDSTNLGYIRSGEIQSATVALPMGWLGWAAVDELVRLFDGQQPVDENLPYQLITSTNLPAPGQNYTGGFDYQSAYKSAWGVG